MSLCCKGNTCWAVAVAVAVARLPQHFREAKTQVQEQYAEMTAAAAVAAQVAHFLKPLLLLLLTFDDCDYVLKGM